MYARDHAGHRSGGTYINKQGGIDNNLHSLSCPGNHLPVINLAGKGGRESGASIFTIVPDTCILGSQYAVISHNFSAA
ncbi:MAG: hypothetical protein M0Z48_11020 [Nitrospiraceae bacterium]|nr:hypothetical protein [Nitrospiraceae bacterium]